jgi:hypothetical protein
MVVTLLSEQVARGAASLARSSHIAAVRTLPRLLIDARGKIERDQPLGPQ